MSVLPIVERELRVAARKPSFYRTRTLVALATGLIMFFFLVAGYFFGSSRLGAQIFTMLVWFAFVQTLLESLRAADALSEEKREGTLGLLFLTDLREYDVVLGKLAAVAVRSLHGLLAFLPVLATALILGGVTLGEFWRSAITLVTTLFFSLSIALGVSAFSRRASRALAATVFLVAVITVVPALFPQGVGLASLKPVLNLLRAMSPALAHRNAADFFYSRSPDNFWLGLAAIHLVAWMALALACIGVRSTRREGRAFSVAPRLIERWRRWEEGGGDDRRADRSRKLDANPFFWLAARHQRESTLMACLFGLLGLITFIGWINGSTGLAYIGSRISTVLLLGLIGWRSVCTFGEARRSGALELLVVTPIPAEAMIHGHWMGLKSLFLWPAAVVWLLRSMAHFELMGLFSSNTASGWFGTGLRLAAMGYDTLSFITSLLAFFWLGTWLGLRRPKLTHAFLFTVLLGLAVPAILVCLPNVLIHLGLLIWARSRLRNEIGRIGKGSGESGPTSRGQSRQAGPRPSGAAESTTSAFVRT